MLGTAVRFSSSAAASVELRPDLLVSSITVTPISGDPAHDLYTAVIANDGNSGAGPFEVLFAPGRRLDSEDAHSPVPARAHEHDAVVRRAAVHELDGPDDHGRLDR